MPVRQRAGTAVLIIGTVLSLGSLVGSDGVLRAGVVVALASAALSCGLAWRELHLTRRRHAQQLLSVGREHTHALRVERQHNADVLETVSDRAHRWRLEVERQQTQLTSLRGENAALRNDLGSVRRQVLRADATIKTLRETVRDRDTELAVLRATPAIGSVDAEVYVMPRRLDRTDAASSAGTFRQVDLPRETPALPNFEADRRRA